MTAGAPARPGQGNGAWRAAFFLALAAVALYVYLRNHGLYPAVFADE